MKKVKGKINILKLRNKLKSKRLVKSKIRDFGEMTQELEAKGISVNKDSLATRMMSSLGRIDQHKLRTGKLNDDDWSRIRSSMHILADAPLYIDDSPALSPADLRSRARRLVKERGQLGLIVVDYLQLMKAPGFKADNRTAEISEISRSLKSLAKELKVPVIALSQLNRSQ